MKKKLIILLFLFNFFPSYTYSEIVYLDVQFILDNSEIGKYYKKKLKLLINAKNFCFLFQTLFSVKSSQQI